MKTRCQACWNVGVVY